MSVSSLMRTLGGAVRRVAAPAIVSGLAAVPATAQVMAQGELAAAIRSAGQPCAKVHEATPAGTETWRVRCNSGEFRVTAKSDGGYDVTPL